MRGELRTPTSHNPGKLECQGKASSGDDSRYADCCDTAGLLPVRPTKRQIGTWGRSFPHLRRSEKDGTPRKLIEGVIQSSGIRGGFSTGTCQNMNESNLHICGAVTHFRDMKVRRFRTIDRRRRAWPRIATSFWGKEKRGDRSCRAVSDGSAGSEVDASGDFDVTRRVSEVAAV